jgi:adenosylmethionine-8-amino-7-oxononanoate aminotransferase
MKVAVLGAAGTIGPAIVRDLASSEEVESILLLDLRAEQAKAVADQHGLGKATVRGADARSSLAGELAAVAPGDLPHVFFSDDGSTAVETALKLAAQYWAQNGRPERRRFLALDGAYHGDTLGAIAAAPVPDTIKEAGPDCVVLQTHDRSRLWTIQTPQAFRADALREALASTALLAQATDDAMLVERIGGRVLLYEAPAENIKVTTPMDLRVAELLLRERA